MNRLRSDNGKCLNGLAVAAGIAMLAQGFAAAQTSEDKSQNGQKASDKMNTKLSGKKGNPAPTQPLALSVTTDKKTYAAGTAIKMTLTAKNTTPQTMNLNFNSGQKYDFILREGTKPDGKIVWQWAKGRMFPMMVTFQKLEPGKSLTFTETYTPTGDALKAGTYTLEAKLATFGERPVAVTQVVIK